MLNHLGTLRQISWFPTFTLLHTDYCLGAYKGSKSPKEEYCKYCIIVVEYGTAYVVEYGTAYVYRNNNIEWRMLHYLASQFTASADRCHIDKCMDFTNDYLKPC